VTLVFQGPYAPWLIRKVGPKDKYSAISEHDQEIIIQKKLAKYSLQFLEENTVRILLQNEHLIISMLE